VEKALSTIEEVTHKVCKITRTIYRKKKKNPVDLVNPVKDLKIWRFGDFMDPLNLLNPLTGKVFKLFGILGVFVALCEKLCQLYLWKSVLSVNICVQMF
jgi:hypothetical protein